MIVAIMTVVGVSAAVILFVPAIVGCECTYCKQLRSMLSKLHQR